MPLRRSKDPTRTGATRKRLLKEVERRIKRLSALVTESVKNIVPAISANEAIQAEEVLHQTEAETVDYFSDWLEIVLVALILGGTRRPTTLDGYRTHYLFGDVYKELVRAGTSARSRLRKGAASGVSLVAASIFEEKSLLFFNRQYDALEGIAGALKSQLTGILSDGLLKGLSAEDITALMLDRIKKTGEARVSLLAKTSTVYASQLAQVIEGLIYEQETGQEVVYLWKTALDERVRITHQLREAKYYTLAKVLALIGEPNCRCAVTVIRKASLKQGTPIESL